jgi:glc operon protein GlcG
VADVLGKAGVNTERVCAAETAGNPKQHSPQEGSWRKAWHLEREDSMSPFKHLGAAVTIVVLACIPAAAQQATPPYGTPISLEQAKKVIAAAEAEAQKNNWPVVITVVDTGGWVVAVHRLDNTQLGSIPFAEDKARTAVLFRRPSKAFEDAVAGGGIGLRVLGLRGATPYDGGVPIFVDGKIIGAIGVSGMLPQQDGQVANAGASALK